MNISYRDIGEIWADGFQINGQEKENVKTSELNTVAPSVMRTEFKSIRIYRTNNGRPVKGEIRQPSIQPDFGKFGQRQNSWCEVVITKKVKTNKNLQTKRKWIANESLPNEKVKQFRLNQMSGVNWWRTPYSTNELKLQNGQEYINPYNDTKHNEPNPNLKHSVTRSWFYYYW